MARYDDAKFGVVQRHWFGLTKKAGGQGAADGFELSADATHVTRFYPKGPMYITKFGVMHLATQGGTEVTVNLKRNSSTLATVIASTDSAPWAIASKAVNKNVDAGSYLVITSEGTVATGSVACFIEWHPKFHVSKWNAENDG